MTRIYFVRHAQPEHSYKDDRTRPLTNEGSNDSNMVLETLKDKEIDIFYCSPYKRSMDTIKKTADFYGKSILTDERFRERECGENGIIQGMIQKRWENRNYHEDRGESLNMVQKRNIEALMEVLEKYRDKNIVIGTHGTALSTILNYYNPQFGFKDFMRLIDWMPYVIEVDFEGKNFVCIKELAYIEKEC